jgi:hypothetical protein
VRTHNRNRGQLLRRERGGMGIEEEEEDEEEDKAVGGEEETMAERIDKLEEGGGEDAVVGLLLR